MNQLDFLKFSRKQLIKHFEQERQEWLTIGVSEANIFRIHFGEDGDGGDYRMWLDERKHIRPDRKYVQGTQLSLESLLYEGEWFEDKTASKTLLEVEQTADIEAIFSNLTNKQRNLLQAIVFDEKSCAEYANENRLNKSTISRNLECARKKMKKFYKKCN